MKTTLLVWILYTIVGYVHGQPDPGTHPCGSDKWTTYKDESCLIVVGLGEDEGFMSKEEADIACNTMSGEDKAVPRLVRIKTKEKQKYLQDFLYDFDVADNIWLGLNVGSDGAFRWNDGAKLYFTNWPKDGGTVDNQRCVQMENGEGSGSEGLWIRTNCQKRNAVVCEKSQTWSTSNLVDAILNLRLELEEQQSKGKQDLATLKEELERRIAALEQEPKGLNGAIEDELKQLKKNPVPIGFVYLQLPYQSEPKSIWPDCVWTDVSQSYAGDFIRVVGGSSNNFGDEQESSAPRLEQVECVKDAVNKWMSSSVPSDGTWSEAVSMGWRTSGDNWRGLRFRMSAAEVRPKNQAIKVWQRLL